LPIAYCRLPIAYCLLPIAYCLLPIAYCLLPIAYCLLPIAYCLLPIAYCLLRCFACYRPSTNAHATQLFRVLLYRVNRVEVAPVHHYPEQRLRVFCIRGR